MNYANVATTSGANIIVPKAPKPSAIVSVSCKRTAAQPPRSSNPKKAKEAIATAAKGKI